MLLEIYRTFSRGSANLLFFQSMDATVTVNHWLTIPPMYCLVGSDTGIRDVTIPVRYCGFDIGRHRQLLLCYEVVSNELFVSLIFSLEKAYFAKVIIFYKV